MLTIGQQATLEVIVTKLDTAIALKSGSLPVLATPRLIAWGEEVSCQAIEGQLTNLQTTVGTKIDLTHNAPTLVGMKVTVHSKLVEIDNRRLIFNIVVKDEAEVVAHGQHERVIVTTDKFMTKVNQKY